jgi:hypothetical protein
MFVFSHIFFFAPSAFFCNDAQCGTLAVPTGRQNVLRGAGVKSKVTTKCIDLLAKVFELFGILLLLSVTAQCLLG